MIKIECTERGTSVRCKGNVLDVANEAVNVCISLVTSLTRNDPDIGRMTREIIIEELAKLVLDQAGGTLEDAEK